MSLIRYHTPHLAAWQSLDRWSNLRDEINHLFEGASAAKREPSSNGWTPALDLHETTNEVVALVELPGLRREQIEISLHDGILTVSGERKDESTAAGKIARSERFVGKFHRSISLPTRVASSGVSAAYTDGILTVTLPKAEDAKPKQIQVNAG